MLCTQNRKGIFDVDLPYAQPSVLSERHIVVVEAFSRLADVISTTISTLWGVRSVWRGCSEQSRVPRTIFIRRIIAKFLVLILRIEQGTDILFEMG